jgi:hypothetical protein
MIGLLGAQRAAAIDAAAGAGHDLDEVIVGRAGANCFGDLAGRLEPVAHGDLDGFVADLKSTVAERCLRNRASWVSSTVSSSLPVTILYMVRKAASITPPVVPKMAPAPEYSVIYGLSKVDGSSAGRLMPSRLSNRANSRVVSTTSISGTPSSAELGAHALVLLCDAGHDGDDADARRVDAHALRQIGLRDLAQAPAAATWSTTARAEYRDNCRSAKLIQAGQHEVKVGRVFSVEPQQFGTFLHDDHVGGKVGVEHDVRADLAQSG